MSRDSLKGNAPVTMVTSVPWKQERDITVIAVIAASSAKRRSVQILTYCRGRCIYTASRARHICMLRDNWPVIDWREPIGLQERLEGRSSHNGVISVMSRSRFQGTEVTIVTGAFSMRFRRDMWTTPIVLLCPALLTHTQNTEKKREQRALSLSLPQSLRFAGFFPLTFRVASGLFFTLVCSTYLLTSRVLVNVGFVQTWCLVECDSRLCLSEIFFFFFKPFKSRECLTLSCCISLKKKEVVV